MPLARFLHISDLHLSRRFGFLPKYLAEERRRDQRKALTRMVNIALEHDVDFLLVAGDTFDSSDPDPTDLEALNSEFQRFTDAGKLIFIIPGNHDAVTPASFWHRLDMHGLYLFIESEWQTVTLENLGIEVTGIAFDRAKSERRAFEGLELTSDFPSIVLAHASYELFEGQIERYHPFSLVDIANTKASYIALGHYHKFNTFNTDTVTACYAGTPEGISFDSPEIGDRFAVLGAINEDGSASIEPLKVNARTMSSFEINLDSYETQSSFLNAVRQLCEKNALVEVKLTGRPNSEVSTSLEGLPMRFKESCAYITFNTANLLLPVDLPEDDRTIRGRFCRYMLQQIENAKVPERKRLLRRSLEVGLAEFSEV